MLSVLIETKGDAKALARTLEALVPAAVEGVVTDVVVLDRGSSDAAAEIADHAGCTLLRGDPAAAIEAARSAWLLILEPGARLEDGWMGEVARHVSAGGNPEAARFTSPKPRWQGFFRRGRGAPRGIRDGLLIGKRQALGQARRGLDLSDLGKGLATRRLKAGIAPPAVFPET